MKHTLIWAEVVYYWFITKLMNYDVLLSFVQNPWGWDFSGSSNMEELQILLEESIMIRFVTAPFTFLSCSIICVSSQILLEESVMNMFIAAPTTLTFTFLSCCIMRVSSPPHKPSHFYHFVSCVYHVHEHFYHAVSCMYCLQHSNLHFSILLYHACIISTTLTFTFLSFCIMHVSCPPNISIMSYHACIVSNTVILTFLSCRIICISSQILLESVMVMFIKRHLVWSSFTNLIHNLKSSKTSIVYEK